jgi:Abortive infection alpha
MSAIDDLSGLARLGVRTWLRTASWSLELPVRAARTAVDVLVASSRNYDVITLPPGDVEELPPEPLSLRERGAELLRRSADVESDDGAHPAYARILEELHPDEARILRLLALSGPQPSVDVRAAQLIGFGSEVVAEGLNMIGAQAGCRHPERVHAYLDNLNRLGLIWFSKQAVPEPNGYQVLEAQPAVLEAVRRASRAKMVQRSIRLTPFGSDFCDVCLPLEQGTSDSNAGTD